MNKEGIYTGIKILEFDKNINDVELILRSLGVDPKDENGNWRNTYEVLIEISEKINEVFNIEDENLN